MALIRFMLSSLYAFDKDFMTMLSIYSRPVANLLALSSLVLGLSTTLRAQSTLSWQSLVLQTPRCGELGTVTQLEDGSAKVSYSKIELLGRGDTICHAVAKVEIPQGFALKTGLIVSLKSPILLNANGDKGSVYLKVQSAEQVDTTRKTLSFSTDPTQDTEVELGATAKIPALGTCRESLETNIHIAVAIRLQSEQSPSRTKMAMGQLLLPPLELVALSCPEPLAASKTLKPL